MSFVYALKTELCFEYFSCQGGFYGLLITPDSSVRCTVASHRWPTLIRRRLLCISWGANRDNENTRVRVWKWLTVCASKFHRNILELCQSDGVCLVASCFKNVLHWKHSHCFPFTCILSSTLLFTQHILCVKWSWKVNRSVPRCTNCCQSADCAVTCMTPWGDILTLILTAWLNKVSGFLLVSTSNWKYNWWWISLKLLFLQFALFLTFFFWVCIAISAFTAPAFAFASARASAMLFCCLCNDIFCVLGVRLFLF